MNIGLVNTWLDVNALNMNEHFLSINKPEI